VCHNCRGADMLQRRIPFLRWNLRVDSLEESDAKVRAAGGQYLTGRKENNPNVYYEVKYKTPEGIVFDLTESGWKGGREGRFARSRSFVAPRSTPPCGAA
jgi:hypothetical protein